MMLRAFAALVLALTGRLAAASELERFAMQADAQFAHRLADLGIAGAALAAGEDGAAVWSRGYGVADVKTKVPLDAAETAFHVASVTKLVTAIAILQLADAGKLALDDDVNKQLAKVRVPPAWGTPITIRHLLTHTSGLDVDYLDLAVTDASRRVPLHTYLRLRLPARIAAPGARVAYSNHGYGLLGAVIESACGCAYADYVQDNIFARAGLRTSAINTHARARALSRAPGYFYRAEVVEEPQLFEHMSAAGGALMSVADVVLLVRALHDGKLLSPGATRAMTAVQFAHHPDLGGGYGFGFWRAPGYSTPVWLIGGDVPGASTRVLYLPEIGFVACIAVNRKDPQPAERLLRDFLRPWAVTPRAASPLPIRSRFSGLYRYHAYPRANFLRLGGLIGASLTVTQTGDALEVALPNEGSLARLVQVQPGLFEQPMTGLRLAFRQDAGGKTWAFLDTFEAGPLAFESVPLHRRPEFAAAGFLLAPFVALAVLLTAFWRRRSANLLAASVLLLLFAATFAYGFHTLAIARDDLFAYEELPPLMAIALVLPWAGVATWVAYAGSSVTRWAAVGASSRLFAVAALVTYGWFWFEVWDWHLYASLLTD